MSKRTQCAVAGVLVAVLLFCGAAAAVSRTETINVTYRNIRMFIDEEELVPKDAIGNIIEPFIYSGSTYLPVRAVSQALGREVVWNERENAVYINSNAPGGSSVEQDSITQIIKSIENREVIDKALFESISADQELVVILNRYNELTSYLFGVFFVKAAQTIVSVTIDGFGFDDGVDFSDAWFQRPPTYPFPPEAITEATLRIAMHALYADAAQRIQDDPFFAPVLEKEGGGSAGMWPEYVQDFSHRPEVNRAFTEYMKLIENALFELRELKAS